MHPNKVPFIGSMPIIGVMSDRCPAGARGHRVLMPAEAVETALPSLVGMALSWKDGLEGHDNSAKIGVIESAEIFRNEVVITGFVWAYDQRKAIESITASEEPLGLSYEIHAAHVDDMRAEVYNISRFLFTGVAVLLRERAAYRNTYFTLV
jgi:hypothetical protein